MLTIHAKDQVPGKITAAKRRRRQVIEQHEISGSPHFQDSYLWEIRAEGAEDIVDDAGIMLKSHLQHQVTWHGTRVAKDQLMHQVGCLHLLHHIHAKAIVTQTNIDACM